MGGRHCVAVTKISVPTGHRTWHPLFYSVLVPPSLSVPDPHRSLCVLFIPLPDSAASAQALHPSLAQKHFDFPTWGLRTPPGPISRVSLCCGCFCSGVTVQMVSSHEACFPSVSSLPFHLSVEQNQNLGFFEKYCHC